MSRFLRFSVLSFVALVTGACSNPTQTTPAPDGGTVHEPDAGRSPDPDSGKPVACGSTLASYCATNPCPPSTWEEANASANLAEWCSELVGGGAQNVIVSTAPCDGVLAITRSDGFIGYAYTYDSNSHALVGVEFLTDVIGEDTCVGAPPPADECLAGKAVDCAQLVSDAGALDAGRD